MKNKNSKQMKGMILVVVFLLLNCLSEVPTTHSKYKSEKEYATIYQNQFYAMQSQEANVHYSENSSKKEGKFFVFFDLKPNHREIGAEPSTCTYIIQVPSGCTIAIDSENNAQQVKDKVQLDGNQIRILGDLENESGTLRVDVISAFDNPYIVDTAKPDQWKISVQVNEQVLDEDQFIYYSQGFATIDKKPVEQQGDRIEIWDGEEKSVYEQLCEWLKDQYSTGGPIYDAIFGNQELGTSDIGYLSVYQNNQFDQVLKGLAVQKDVINGRTKYTFTLQENFVGYARTNYHYKYNEKNQTTPSLKMYFSTEDRNLLTEIFYDYYSRYIYPSQPENIDLIRTYFAAQSVDLATFILTGTPEIEGMDWTSKEELTTSNHLLDLAKKYAASLATPPVSDEPSLEEPSKEQIPFGTKEEMLASLDAYFDQIKTIHPEYSFSLSALLKVKESQEVRDSMTQNSTDDMEKKAFTDYFLFLDEETQQYFITKTFSDGVTANTITLDTLSITKEMMENMTFEKSPISNTIQVVLSFTSSFETVEVSEEEKLKLQNIVHLLDAYFQTESVMDESTITKEEGLVSLTYSISFNEEA